MKRFNRICIGVAAVLLLLLGGYMEAYFARSKFGHDEGGRQVRLFNTAAAVRFFTPLIWIESRIRGRWFYVTSELTTPDLSISETQPLTQD